MEENLLVWSCNKSKFLKVLALSDTENYYRERFGRKAGSVWFIEIRATIHPHVLPNDHMKWQVYLVREHSLVPTSVTAKFSSGPRVFLRNRTLNFDSGEKSVFIDDFTMNIVDYQVDVVIIFQKRDESVAIISEKTLISQTTNLTTDFQQMFKNKHFTDVTLKCDATILKAHKCILSARSPVFATMFSSAMQESETDTVVITDLSSEVLDAMINFLYCGEVTIESAFIVCDLLYAAEKYQIKALKEGCVTCLKCILSCDNAIEILQVADLHDKRLKSDLLCFIKEHFMDLEHTGEFLQLKSEKPALALEVYSYKL